MPDHPVIRAIGIFFTGVFLTGGAYSAFVMSPPEAVRWATTYGIPQEDKINFGLKGRNAQVTELEAGIQSIKDGYEDSLAVARTNEESLRSDINELRNQLDAKAIQLKEAQKALTATRDTASEARGLSQALSAANKKIEDYEAEISKFRNSAQTSVGTLQIGSNSNISLKEKDILIYYKSSRSRDAWNLKEILQDFSPNSIKLTTSQACSYLSDKGFYYRSTDDLGLALGLRDYLAEQTYEFSGLYNRDCNGSPYEFEIFLRK